MACRTNFGEYSLVPTETVKSIRNNVRRVQSRKCLPGYMIVLMELDSETSHLVRATAKIAGFVGGSKMPLPISQNEAERMMQLSKGAKITVVSMEFAGKAKALGLLKVLLPIFKELSKKSKRIKRNYACVGIHLWAFYAR